MHTQETKPKIITFRAGQPFVKQVAEACRRLGVDRSEFLRRAGTREAEAIINNPLMEG